MIKTIKKLPHETLIKLFSYALDNFDLRVEQSHAFSLSDFFNQDENRYEIDANLFESLIGSDRFCFGDYLWWDSYGRLSAVSFVDNDELEVFPFEALAKCLEKNGCVLENLLEEI